jgi:hypothetical protein
VGGNELSITTISECCLMLPSSESINLYNSTYTVTLVIYVAHIDEGPRFLCVCAHKGGTPAYIKTNKISCKYGLNKTAYRLYKISKG